MSLHFDGSVFERRFGILPPIKREALTMKVEWPAFTVERWPNHSPDQLRLQQAPPRGNLGYSITSSARDPGDPRCSALAANRPFAMDIRGVVLPDKGRAFPTVSRFLHVPHGRQAAYPCSRRLSIAIGQRGWLFPRGNTARPAVCYPGVVMVT